MKIIAGRFAGRRAVVTGASSGIGRATALRLAAEGARVGLVGLQSEPLAATAAEITAAGGETLVLVADVTAESEIQMAMDTAAETWGGLDIIVSNAGIELLGQDDRVDRLDRDVWDRLITTNLTGRSSPASTARGISSAAAVAPSSVSARTAPLSAWPPTSPPIARARAACWP